MAGGERTYTNVRNGSPPKEIMNSLSNEKGKKDQKTRTFWNHANRWDTVTKGGYGKKYDEYLKNFPWQASWLKIREMKINESFIQFIDDGGSNPITAKKHQYHLKIVDYSKMKSRNRTSNKFTRTKGKSFVQRSEYNTIAISEAKFSDQFKREEEMNEKCTSLGFFTSANKENYRD